MFASAPIDKGEVVVVWGGKNFVDTRAAMKAKTAGKKVQQIDEDVFDVFTHEEALSDPTYFIIIRVIRTFG